MACARGSTVPVTCAAYQQQARPVTVLAARGQTKSLRAIGGQHAALLRRDQPCQNHVTARCGRGGKIGGERDQRPGQDVGDQQIIGCAVTYRGMIGPRCRHAQHLPARAADRKAVLDLQEERLRAFIEGRKPSLEGLSVNRPDLATDSQAFFTSMTEAAEKERTVINDQIRQKKQSIAILAAELNPSRSNFDILSSLLQKRRDLNRQGILSDVKLLETQQRYNEIAGKIDSLRNQIAMSNSTIKEYENRLASLSISQIDAAHKQLESTVAERMQNNELIEKIKSRIARMEVRAPVDGIVKGITVNTIGGVVQPGQALMEIVPSDTPLVVNLKIPPRYVGHIREGQPVQVKFSSYDFARYGAVPGTLAAISATTFSGEQGERFYEGKVMLGENNVGGDPKNRILPGMTVMADIVTGEKTILQYLLKPIRTAAATAFTER